jgi:hypothetical protein
MFTLQIKKGGWGWGWWGVDMIKVDKYSYMTSIRCWTEQMHALLVELKLLT